MKQFGWAYVILTKVPEALVALFHPLSRALFKLRNGGVNLIKNAAKPLTYGRHF